MVLKPTLFSWEEIEWNNLLTLCSSTLNYQFGNRPFKFDIQLEDETMQSQAMHCIKFKTDKHFFWITVDQLPESFVVIHSELFYLLHSTSKSIQNMAAENILSPVIEWIEQAFELKITVVDYYRGIPNLQKQLSFPFYYQENENDSVSKGRIALSKDLKMPLFKQLKRWPSIQNTAIDTLRLSTALVIGSTIITAAELNTVERGDVIFLDQDIYSEGYHMWAHFPPYTLITLRKEPRMATQNNAITPSASSTENMTNVSVEAVTDGDIPTQSQSENNEDQSTAENLSLDTLEIKLDFDLGSISLSLAQIKQLTPGYVFSVGRPLEHSVNISSNGQRLASGELVDINGIVGVRVTDLYKKNNG